VAGSPIGGLLTDRRQTVFGFQGLVVGGVDGLFVRSASALSPRGTNSAVVRGLGGRLTTLVSPAFDLWIDDPGCAFSAIRPALEAAAGACPLSRATAVRIQPRMIGLLRAAM
jgi:hypothetical protein